MMEKLEGSSLRIHGVVSIHFFTGTCCEAKQAVVSICMAKVEAHQERRTGLAITLRSDLLIK